MSRASGCWRRSASMQASSWRRAARLTTSDVGTPNTTWPWRKSRSRASGAAQSSGSGSRSWQPSMTTCAALAWCQSESGRLGDRCATRGGTLLVLGGSRTSRRGAPRLEWALEASAMASSTSRGEVAHRWAAPTLGATATLQMRWHSTRRPSHWRVPRMITGPSGLGSASWESPRGTGATMTAVVLFEGALALFQGVADPWGVAWCVGNLGYAALARGDLEAATARSRRAWPCFACRATRSASPGRSGTWGRSC